MLLIEELQGEDIKLQAQWIPSHVGIEGNDKDTELANDVGDKQARPKKKQGISFMKAGRGVAELWNAILHRD